MSKYFKTCFTTANYSFTYFFTSSFNCASTDGVFYMHNFTRKCFHYTFKLILNESASVPVLKERKKKSPIILYALQPTQIISQFPPTFSKFPRALDRKLEEREV